MPGPKNKMSDLRNHLFEEIENLKDASPEDLEKAIRRAQAVVNVAQAITNSAKVEVDLVVAVSGSRPASIEFFGMPEESRALPSSSRPAESLRQIRGPLAQ